MFWKKQNWIDNIETMNMLEEERKNIRNLIKGIKKDKVPIEYNLIIGMIKDRIDVNKDDENLVRRLKNLLNDVMAISSLDMEGYDVKRHFIEDYD